MPAPVSKSAKSVSKSAKSAPKALPTRTEPQADKGNTHRGRERRPSDKVAAQLLEQQEAELLKAQKAERRALREKKALQKAHQQENLPSDGEGEYEPRESPMFMSREVVNKPSQISLGHRSGKVPPAPTATTGQISRSESLQLELDEDPVDSERPQTPIEDYDAALPGPGSPPPSPTQSEPPQSPIIPKKRQRDATSDLDDDEVVEGPTTKAQKINTNAEHPKAADYTICSKHLSRSPSF